MATPAPPVQPWASPEPGGASCKQLLHEATDVRACVHQVFRVLKPGGTAFFIGFDANGSRVAAAMIRLSMRLLVGKGMADRFWRSLSHGLPRDRAVGMAREAGFPEVSATLHGPNYFVVARR